MAAPELRPMGIGDILDVTFRLYRQRFLTFLLIALVVYVPYALLIASFRPFQVAAAAPAFPQQEMTQEAQLRELSLAMQPDPVGMSLSLIGIAVFAIVLLPLCTAALVQNISATYLGEELTAGQSYAKAAPRLLALIGTQFLAGLAILVGFILCIIPGVIFSLWFCVLAPAVVLEAKSGSSAMGRSRELMRGNLDKGFVLGLVVGILSWIINFAVSSLANLVPWPHVAIQVFVANLVLAIILPLQTAPWILLYYDLRIRKEAFDLQMLSESLGQPTAGGPATT